MLTKADLIEALQPIYRKLDDLESGQKSLNAGQKNLEASQKSLVASQKSLEARQKSLEAGQKSLEAGQKSLEAGQKSLEAGQQEIKKIIKQQNIDTADFFHETWRKMDEMKNSTDKRIKRIEDHLGLKHS